LKEQQQICLYMVSKFLPHLCQSDGTHNHWAWLYN